MIDFCNIKKIQKALTELDENFKKEFGICLNAASILYRLGECSLTSSEIAKCADLKASHTSKTICGIEDLGLIIRKVGTTDKRKMRFSLSEDGELLLKRIKSGEVVIPEILKPVLDSK